MPRPRRPSEQPLFRATSSTIPRQRFIGGAKRCTQHTHKNHPSSYHRRSGPHIDANESGSTIIGLVKSAFQGIGALFKATSSPSHGENPLADRIRHLEDDLRFLQHKNQILESRYTVTGESSGEQPTIGASNKAPRIDQKELPGAGCTFPQPTLLVRRNSIRMQPISDSEAIEAESICGDTPMSLGTSHPTEAIASDFSIPIAPSSPQLPSRTKQVTLAALIPVAPPAPPLPPAEPDRRSTAQPIPKTRRIPRAVGLSSAASAIPSKDLTASSGIDFKEILNVKLKPAPARAPIPRSEQSSFQVCTEDLLTVSLRPAVRRGRSRKVSDEPASDDDFALIRSHMKKRIESIYSPAVPDRTVESDIDWSISPRPGRHQ